MYVNEKMYELGSKKSAIRELFEYGKKKAKEVGAENVYDFSLGNPTVPAPDCVNETIRELTNELDSISLHGYTSAQGDEATRKAIADTLKAEGIPTPSKKGCNWTVNNIHSILTNEKYKGEFTDADRVMIGALADKLRGNTKLTNMALSTDPQIFAESIFPQAFNIAAQDSYMESQETYTTLFEDQGKYNAIMSTLADMLYREMRHPGGKKK